MKKYIIITVLLLLAGSGTLHAQTFSDDNFVYTSTPKKAVQSANYSTLTKDEVTQNVTYFDGLGRPVQTTAINQGGNGSDIITPMGYDVYGRQIREYLPYWLSNSTVNYPRIGITSSLTSLTGLYNTAKYDNTTNPFSEKSFEPSPLNRILKQAAPGASWAMNNGHEIKTDYQSNKTDEVKLYRATTNWDTALGLYTIAFVDGGFYGANELQKNVIYDENSAANPTETSGSMVEFKNKDGKVVLKRTYDAGVKHDTYYVYDTYGNLIYVLPPKAEGTITVDILNNLCYQYKYDVRNRLVEKKLPGKQWEFIVYDKLDRVVASGPANSPFSDITSVGWVVTKYDVLNRPVITAWLQGSVTNLDRKTLQDAQNLLTTNFSETKIATATNTTINGVAFRYNNNAWPTSGYHVLTVNYYDEYNYPNAPTIPASIETQPVYYNTTVKPKGLATGSWVRVLETSTLYKNEFSYTLYDDRARPIRNYTQNHLGGYTYIDSKLDFSGKVEYSITRHKRISTDAELMTKDVFTYSAQDRLLTQTNQINGGTVELIVSNSYDELGKLISKKVGNTTAAPTQNVNYSYNVRGWLTGINDVAALSKAGDAKDLFAFKINYNTTSTAGVSPLYNGNISETYWTSNNSETTLRGYGYIYDNLNRLKTGIFKQNGTVNNFYDETLTYDKNGNIMSLVRNGNASAIQQIDNLVYSYGTGNISNQLTKVVDNATTYKAGGFVDSAANTVDDYAYDANGNMIKDNNKNITTIIYNHLNLPAKITFATTGNIVYLYNATGQKVQKVVNETSKAAVTTDYLSGYLYDNAALKFFPTAEGYVEPVPGSYKYVYQYKDHLGNVRLSYDKTLVIKEESNFYSLGLKQEGYNNVKTGVENKYKYNGKELQDELGLNFYDYGARNYDSALGRWMNIDPLAEKSRRWSPYNYCYNNPIRFIDPDGMEGQDWVKKGNKWTYVESIKSPAQATAAGYEDFKANGSIVSNAKLGSGESGDVYLGSGGSAHYATAEDYAVANNGKDFANAFWNGTQGGAYLYSGGFNYESKYAGLSGNQQFFTASAYNNTGTGALPLALDLGGSVSGATGTISGRLGTENIGMYGNANGSAFTLEGSISTGILTGEGSKYGGMLGGNLGAHVLKGEYTTGFSMGGFSYQGTVGGSLASAHIGVNMGSNYNLSNGTLNIHFTENIGLGIGEKAGFEMTIPIPFVK